MVLSWRDSPNKTIAFYFLSETWAHTERWTKNKFDSMCSKQFENKIYAWRKFSNTYKFNACVSTCQIHVHLGDSDPAKPVHVHPNVGWEKLHVCVCVWATAGGAGGMCGSGKKGYVEAGSSPTLPAWQWPSLPITLSCHYSYCCRSYCCHYYCCCCYGKPALQQRLE